MIEITDPTLFSLYIGLGMILSLFLAETLGVTAGGIIVPGYIALNLDDPNRIITTFVISSIVYLIMQLLSKFILIYGKRRIVLALILGFLFGSFFRIPEQNSFFNIDLVVIGNIIPGLIANWMDKQGVIRTISTVLITACVTHLFIQTLFVYQILVIY
tara:strand:+ start:549 stop:1022 length:474 start_codon:yes stop_codon:yes gene_type:complete